MADSIEISKSKDPIPLIDYPMMIISGILIGLLVKNLYINEIRPFIQVFFQNVK